MKEVGANPVFKIAEMFDGTGTDTLCWLFDTITEDFLRGKEAASLSKWRSVAVSTVPTHCLVSNAAQIFEPFILTRGVKTAGLTSFTSSRGGESFGILSGNVRLELAKMGPAAMASERCGLNLVFRVDTLLFADLLSIEEKWRKLFWLAGMTMGL